MSGDLLFYHPTDLIGRIVAFFTHGPFCHVEVDLGDGFSLGAEGGGVTIFKRTPTDEKRLVRWDIHNANSGSGLTWALQQRGMPYSWGDIVDVIFRILRLPLTLSEPGHFDCSHFAYDYLRAAGYPLPPCDPRFVTPNSLAKALGVY